MLVRFLREHRSEWADYGVDAYSSASLKASPYAVPCARPGVPSSQVILPLAQTVEHEEVSRSYVIFCGCDCCRSLTDHITVFYSEFTMYLVS